MRYKNFQDSVRIKKNKSMNSPLAQNQGFDILFQGDSVANIVVS